MYVSQESAEQVTERLLKVIASSDFKIYDGLYTFEEFAVEEFPNPVITTALAIVRDEDVWSALVQTDDLSKEVFKIFSFHFKQHLDNSGFVGWLATHLKQQIGTGVFVTCGQNTNRGGIFDYWGCPASVAQSVLSEVAGLIEKGRNQI